jgi:hypothetical protein
VQRWIGRESLRRDLVQAFLEDAERSGERPASVIVKNVKTIEGTSHAQAAAEMRGK